jgi:hypothetical protein
VALPAKPAGIAPSGLMATLSPTHTWQKAARAESYQIYVNKVAGGAAMVSTYPAGSLCNGSGVCTATPFNALVAGTAYRWRVRGVNAAGDGPWSNYVNFQTKAGLPGATVLLAPSNSVPITTAFPTYRWLRISAATHYYLTVRSASGVVLSRSYTTAEVCGTSACVVTPATGLPSGSYSSVVQTRNAAGYGPLSVENNFTTAVPPMTMVLTWGANPRDLDSHLRTPSGHHVYYGSRGSAISAPYATLDVDDTSGFGPETMILHQAQTGTYRYFVHRYAGTGTLAGSGAKVKLYRGATLVSTFTAPATGTGDYWEVCTITNATTGARTCPNRIVATAPLSVSDAPLRLPAKDGGK